MRIMLAISLLVHITAAAQLQVAKLFSSNMVLQRNQPIRIWGKSMAGAQVTAVFAGQTKSVTANKDSAWQIEFAQQQANSIPQAMVITAGNEQVTFSNLLIGDVWLCVGQSNMEFPMRQELHFAEAKKQAAQPMLRLYNPTFIGSGFYGKSFTDSMMQRLQPSDFYNGNWQTCDSISFQNMSAIGYYFGKQISGHENIPVGMINLSIGGAPIETFISANALEAGTFFAKKLNGNWLTNEALPVWIRQRGNENLGDNKIVHSTASGPNHAFKPGFAFAAGIEPMTKMPIKGILWYQGESNAQEKDRVFEYAALQQLMVAEYRQQWQQPNLPFYWVQLSSIDSVKYKSQWWPDFRNEQRKLIALIPNGGMAVSSDIGDKNDVHPRNKKLVAERLAVLALNKTYHRNMLPSGPLVKNAMYKNGKVIIHFNDAGKHLQTADDMNLRGFSLDGKNESTAVIKNKTVVIVAEKKPAYVYYGWAPFTNANLVNNARLPASTFKMEVQ